MRDTYAENCKTLLKEIKRPKQTEKTKNPLPTDKNIILRRYRYYPKQTTDSVQSL